MAVLARTKTDRASYSSVQSLSEICRITPETVPVCKPQLPSSSDISKYLARIDASRRYSNHGGLLVEFQDRLYDITARTAHVSVASSGTAALAGAILALTGRARPTRSLCLVPAYTFIGTVAAIEQCGFVPYFIDIDPDTWMIDADRCARHRLLDEVGLVVPVAPYGRPVQQSDWTGFTKRTGIPVVIDGAAAFESLVSSPKSYLGKIPVAVSFHATKSLSTGEGGAVFCDDSELSRAATQCLNFGYDLDRVCRRPCINGKMSEYHAAIGLAELDRWENKKLRFERAAKLYRSHAEAQDRFHLAPSVASNYALYEARSLIEAKLLLDLLGQLGIGNRLWYGGGVHSQPYCAAYGCDEVRHTEDLAGRLIGLPMSVDLDADAVHKVTAALAVVQELSKSMYFEATLGSERYA